MSDDKFAYWGMRDTGKFVAECNFLKNGKITTFFKHHYYYTQYPVEKYDYGYKYERVFTYRKPNDNQLSRVVNKTTIIRYDAIHTDDLWHYENLSNFVDGRVRHSYTQNDGKMDDVMYEYHANLPDLKDAYHRVIDESNIIIQPERLLGFTDKEDLILEGINDLQYSFQKQITERLQNEIVHVIPYKSNLIDWAVNKLNSADFSKWGFVDLFDAYLKNKFAIWKLLDSYVITSRNLEVILKSRGLNYQYFDMDNDCYLKYFGLNYEFPRNFTHLTYRVKTGDVKWDEDAHKRYDKLLSIAERYIYERNIKDLRLNGANNDGIK